MNPLLALVIQQIIINAPALAIELVQILSKQSYTDADFDALKLKYQGKTYEEYIAANAAKG